MASFEARGEAGWTAEIHPAPATADQAVGQDEDDPSRPPSPAPARPVTIALVTPPEPPPRPVVGPRPAVDASEPPQTTGSIAPLDSPGVSVKAASLTPSDIARNMIAASRAYYRRTRSACACPDDTDELGRLCGDRSGYRGPLVLRPLCQEADITAEMIEDYKRTGSIIFAGQ